MNAVSSDIENVQPAGDAALFRQLAAAPLLAAAFVFLTSVLVSVGWAFDIDTLRRVAPGYVVMNPVTAALFILSSAALFLVQTATERRIRLARACAVIVSFVGLIHLCALVGIFDVGIDQIFFSKPFFDVASGVPNRMAPNTALNFLLFGAAILLLNVETRRRDFFPAQYPLVVVLLTAFLATVGYLYGAKSFYMIVSFNPMAIHTATSFLILSVGLLLSKPRRGWAKEIFSPFVGGQQARRLFTLVIIIPLVLGWIQLKGEQLGLYTTEIGFAMLIVGICIILGFLVIYSARLTNRTAGRLVQTEDALDSKTKLMNLLGESETRYRQLADAMPQIVWTAQPDGSVDYWNRRWFDYTGMTHEETEGWGWQPVLHPDDAQNCIALWTRALETGERYTVEYRFLRADGEYRWYLGQALPVRDPENRIVKWFGTGTDIQEQKNVEEQLRLIQEQLEQRVKARTAELERANRDLTEEIAERRRAEEELKDFAARLERSNNELQDFASVASHDLQEPLRKVQAFGDRLKATCGDALNERERDYLERMLNAAGRMQTLINDLLSFSRVATKTQPFVTINLRAVTDKVLSDLEQSIGETNATVEVGELATIDADPTQMRQLLQNLVGNALKFNRPGVPPVVKISGRVLESGEVSASGAAGATYRLTVEDNGIGFDNKHVERIFKIFQRLHSRSEYEGTGIGLAVCRRIAERHGGSIAAHSNAESGATSTAADSGATFTVDLPVRQIKAVEIKNAGW